MPCLFASCSNTEHLHVRRVSRRTLLSVVGGLLLFEAALTAAWVAVDSPALALRPDPLARFADVRICDSARVELWWSLFAVPKGMIAFALAWLSFRVRNIDKQFNESRHIFVAVRAAHACACQWPRCVLTVLCAWQTYNLIFCIVIGAPRPLPCSVASCLLTCVCLSSECVQSLPFARWWAPRSTCGT